MNREEAKVIITDDMSMQAKETFKAINCHIDNIFDDFESRICENCKNYVQGCCWLFVSEDTDEPSKDFGCNKFERRKQ